MVSRFNEKNHVIAAMRVTWFIDSFGAIKNFLHTNEPS